MGPCYIVSFWPMNLIDLISSHLSHFHIIFIQRSHIPTTPSPYPSPCPSHLLRAYLPFTSNRSLMATRLSPSPSSLYRSPLSTHPCIGFWFLGLFGHQLVVCLDVLNWAPILFLYEALPTITPRHLCETKTNSVYLLFSFCIRRFVMRFIT